MVWIIIALVGYFAVSDYEGGSTHDILDSLLGALKAL